MTLQAELDQILFELIESTSSHKLAIEEADYMQAEALKAILATVSKHLPEKIHIEKQYRTSMVDRLAYDLAYNTAITEMEKTLGGNDK